MQKLTVTKPGDYTVGAGLTAQKAGKYVWVVQMDKSAQTSATQAVLMDSVTSGTPEPTERTTVAMRLSLSSQVSASILEQGSKPVDTVTVHVDNWMWMSDDAGKPIPVMLHGTFYGASSTPFTDAANPPKDAVALFTTDIPVTLPTSGNADVVVTVKDGDIPQTLPTSQYGVWVWEIRDQDNPDMAKYWEGQPKDAFGLDNETVAVKMDLGVSSDVPTGQRSIDKGQYPGDTVTVRLTDPGDLWITDAQSNPVVVRVDGTFYGYSSKPYTQSGSVPAGTPVIGSTAFTITLPTSGSAPVTATLPPQAQTIASSYSGYGVWVWRIVVDNQTVATKQLLTRDTTDDFGVTVEQVLTRLDLTLSSDATDAATGAHRDGANGPGVFQNPSSHPLDSVTLCLADAKDHWVTTKAGAAPALVLDGTFYAGSDTSWFQNGVTDAPPSGVTALASTKHTVTLPTTGSACATYQAPVTDVSVPAGQYGVWVWTVAKASQAPEVADLLQRDVTDRFGVEKETIVTRMAPVVRSHAVELVDVTGTPVANTDGSSTATFTRQQKQTDGSYQDVTTTGVVWKVANQWFADTTLASRVNEPLAGESTSFGDRVWVDVPAGSHWLTYWGTTTPVQVSMDVSLYHAATIPAAPVDPATSGADLLKTWTLAFTQPGVSQIVTHDIVGDTGQEGFYGFTGAVSTARQATPAQDYLIPTATGLWQDGRDQAGAPTASEDQETIAVLKRDAKIKTTAWASGTTDATFDGPDVFLGDDIWQLGWPAGPEYSTTAGATEHGAWTGAPGWAGDATGLTMELWAVDGDVGPDSCTPADPHSRLVASRTGTQAGAIPAANTWTGKNVLSGSAFKTDQINITYTFVTAFAGDDRVMPYRSMCGEPSETLVYRETHPQYITEAVHAGDERQASLTSAQLKHTSLVAGPGDQVSDVLTVWAEGVGTLTPLIDMGNYQVAWDVYFRPAVGGVPDAMAPIGPSTVLDPVTGRQSIELPSPVTDEESGQKVFTDAVCSTGLLMARTPAQAMTRLGAYTSPAVTVPDASGLLYFQEVVSDASQKDAAGNPVEVHRGQCGVARETVAVDKDIPGFITQQVVTAQADTADVTLGSAKAQDTASTVLGGGPAKDVLVVDAGKKDTIDWDAYQVRWDVFFTPTTPRTPWETALAGGRPVYTDAVCDATTRIAQLPAKPVTGIGTVVSDEFVWPNLDGLGTVVEVIEDPTRPDASGAPTVVRTGVCGSASESTVVTEYVPQFLTQVVTPDEADQGVDQVTPDTIAAVDTSVSVTGGSQVRDILNVTADPGVYPVHWDEYQVHWDTFFMASPQATGENNPHRWLTATDEGTQETVYAGAVCDATTRVGSSDTRGILGEGNLVSPLLDVPQANGLFLVQEVVTSTTRTQPGVDEDGAPVDEPLVVHTGRCGLVAESAETHVTPVVDIEKWSTDEGWEQDALGDHDSQASSKPLDVGADEQLTFTVTNTGPEPLVMVEVTDVLVDGVNPVTDLSCDFTGALDPTRTNVVHPDLSVQGLDGWTKYVPVTVTPVAPDTEGVDGDGTVDDGDQPVDDVSQVPSTGTAWEGPFLVGASFACTGTVPGLPAGTLHGDSATVAGFGQFSGTPVGDTDDWWGHVPPADIHTGGMVAPADRTPRWPAVLIAAGLVLSGAATIALVARHRRRHG